MADGVERVTWVEGSVSGGPLELVLLDWEQAERAASVAGTHSDAPSVFVPLVAPSVVYSHVGHDAQYRAVRRNGRSVRLVILHTTETDSFDGSMRYNARRSQMVSCTAHVGKDGEVGLDVPEESVPWTTGRWNDESLSVEVCGRMVWSAAEWRARPAQIASLVDLLVDWCFRFDIPVVWLGPAEVAEGASREGEVPVQGVRRGITDHWDANLAARLLGRGTSSTSHNDIGEGLREVVLVDVFPEVARRVDVLKGGGFSGGSCASGGVVEVLSVPQRVLDTRRNGPMDGFVQGSLAAGEVRFVGLPSELSGCLAVFVNLTVVSPVAAGHLTAWAGSGGDFGGVPDVSNVNYVAGQNVCNTSWVPVVDGRFAVRSHVGCHLVVDVQGVLW